MSDTAEQNQNPRHIDWKWVIAVVLKPIIVAFIEHWK